MIDKKEFVKMVDSIASNVETNSHIANKEFIEDFMVLLARQDNVTIDDATHALVGSGALYMRAYKAFRQGKGYKENEGKTTDPTAIAGAVYDALFTEDGTPVMPADALAALVISLYHIYGVIVKQKMEAAKGQAPPMPPGSDMYA
jgi:hypothetical protein